MWEIIARIFPYAVAFTIPLLITALGGLFSERSGIVNIGLEGLMIVGSFSSAVTIRILQPFLPVGSIYIALVVAMLAGMLFSVLHAFACINLNANQVISGTAINMVALSLTVFLARNITGSGNITIVSGLARFDVPLFSQIPILGKLIFTQVYWTTPIVLLILLVSWFVIYKTPFGLRLRSCGENPHAADSMGINVYKVRYVGVLLSGAFSGLGGAIILVTYSGEFTGSVFGLGFLALASLIFGQWRPLGILGATFFFGLFSTIANVSQVIPQFAAIPNVFLKIFPYVITMVALVLSSKSSQAPRAGGQPFEHGKR